MIKEDVVPAVLHSIYLISNVVFNIQNLVICRAVGRSENLGVPVSFGGHNLPPLVEIGLTDLPKPGTPRNDRPEYYFSTNHNKALQSQLYICRSELRGGLLFCTSEK